MVLCSRCDNAASLKRSQDGNPVCCSCFIELFEQDVHDTIVKCGILKRGEKVAVGASGGKDSTVVAYVLNVLNKRYDYGVELHLLSIDEGIKGYRDDSLKAVERNRVEYGLPLTILSYKDLYGWSMDEIVSKIGKKNNCTFCGVFRRQALDRGALMLGANRLVTGHNADDMAETILMNVLRGDIARLQRCTTAVTGSEGCLPRAKPLKYTFERDIVMYAHYKKLDYFSTECLYAPNAYRGYARNFIKELGRTRPRAILDVIRSGEDLAIRGEIALPDLTNCERCGYISSQKLCKACLLLDGLNTNDLTLGVKKQKSKSQKISEGGQCSAQGKTCACTGARDPSEEF
ncbi:Cytoplasmic tRNA 2-thiolation protein 1 [Toxocara canis]|uniref:Cytoplasmic tRNA 2-thiolation protein 1 n=1 Tax=Toxocara canis TaxID=6265 RepID=A0A0B2VMA4_TOXCA|nr:Cytoplasmic tRNA 2-thiolation protein 1 [Toxocara canis]